MNERIKELAEQAGLLPKELGPVVETRHMKNKQQDLEKFAELIVRECIEQGDNLAKHYIDTHPEQEQVMLLASIADYSKEIKKHFGVEE